MTRPTVLVTGGAGYVGSHACKALRAEGYLPITLDSLARGHADAVRWGPLEEGDVGNRDLLGRLFSTHRPHAVLHFAAFAYVGESVHSPDLYYRNNVAGTIALLDAMRHHGCSRIVFSSSCATYGEPHALPIAEDHPQRPINPYGWSKLMIEQMLRDYEQAFGIRYVSLRYFNAAGADPDGEAGEDHDPETHLIPLAIEAALDQRSELRIFGVDYPTPDGTAIRDYVHVSDLAAAHVASLRYLLDGNRGTSLNVGTGLGHSVREVVKAVEAATQRRVPTKEAPRRPGDPPVLVADARRAAATLGWQPRYRDIGAIVATAVRWHIANGSNRRTGTQAIPQP